MDSQLRYGRDIRLEGFAQGRSTASLCLTVKQDNIFGVTQQVPCGRKCKDGGVFIPIDFA